MGAKASRPSYMNGLYEDELVNGLGKLQMRVELYKRIRKKVHSEGRNDILASHRLFLFARYRELPIIADEVCQKFGRHIAAAVKSYNAATGRRLETKEALKVLGRPTTTNAFLDRAFKTLNVIRDHADDDARDAKLLEDDDTEPWYDPIKRVIENFMNPGGGCRNVLHDYDDLQRRLVETHGRKSRIDADLHV